MTDTHVALFHLRTPPCEMSAGNDGSAYLNIVPTYSRLDRAKMKNGDMCSISDIYWSNIGNMSNGWRAHFLVD
ncbi:hypothetical protein GCM10022381_25520 [Leifsonia kafniensis]|uniref:Uncharacterized protein n=1 Tax=Leifsonia kafniensis TaxID=475957 RepID=A0ABP7KLV6_9MICO